MKISLVCLWLIAGIAQTKNMNSDSGTCAGTDTLLAASADEDALGLVQLHLRIQPGRAHLVEPESNEQYARMSRLHNFRMYAENQLWEQAVLEANINKTDISRFGQRVVKFPKSLVEQLLSEKKQITHKHKYNMMGRITGNLIGFASGKIEEEKRQWAIDFAKANFTEHDIWVCTGYEGEWKTLGEFDRTRELGDRDKHQYEYCEGCPSKSLDLTYWRTLMSSDFTLCPGGDGSWSFRTYEAALAGSVCVIKSYEDDWAPSAAKYLDLTGLQKVYDLFKNVLVSDPHVYNASVADHNRRMFIRYLTFMEGDNTPPGFE